MVVTSYATKTELGYCKKAKNLDCWSQRFITYKAGII